MLRTVLRPLAVDTRAGFGRSFMKRFQRLFTILLASACLMAPVRATQAPPAHTQAPTAVPVETQGIPSGGNTQAPEAPSPCESGMTGPVQPSQAGEAPAPEISEDPPLFQESADPETPDAPEPPPALPDSPPAPDVPVEGESPEAPEVPDVPEVPQEPSVVLGLAGSQPVSIPIVQNLYQDCDALYRTMEALTSLPVQVQRPDGTVETVYLTVDWPALDNGTCVDCSAPGLYAESGTILLPDDTYVFAETASPVLTLPVEVIVPKTAFVLTAVDPQPLPPQVYAVESAGALSSLLRPQTWTVYEENGTPHTTAVEWDLSALSTPGLYTVTGSLTAPLHGVYAQDLVLPEWEAVISLQAPNEPDLNCCVLRDGAYLFPWVLPECGLDGVSASLWENGTLLADPSCALSWSEEGLQVHPEGLSTGAAYRLQVHFADCATGLLSFTYTDPLIITGYGPAPLPEEPPAPPKEEEPPAPPVQEPEAKEDPPAPSKPAIRPDADLNPSAPAQPPQAPPAASTVPGGVSGSSLLLMLEHDGQAEFSEEQMTALFSRESLWDLDIQEEDIFSVILRDEGENSFSIAVTRNGEFVEEFKEVQVVVPYQTETEAPILELLDEEGNVAAAGTYDPAQKLASFTLSSTGRYTITEKAPEVLPDTPPAEPDVSVPPAASTPAVTEPQQAPVTLYLIFAALFALCAAAFLVLRKKKP